ncbi:hypothetical protein Tsubulata_033857, partial [Turnera subulata]
MTNQTITGFHFINVMYIRGKFYAFANNGFSVTIDPNSLKITLVALSKQNSCCFNPYDVLESFGNIFGVFEYTYDDIDEVEGEIVRIQVEELDEETKEWVRAGDELKDSVGFLVTKYSFSFGQGHARPPAPSWGHTGSGVVIYEMENGR